MTMSEEEPLHKRPLSDGSIARVLWVVASLDYAGKREVCEVLDMKKSTAGRQLSRLYHSGLVEKGSVPVPGYGVERNVYRLNELETND